MMINVSGKSLFLIIHIQIAQDLFSFHFNLIYFFLIFMPKLITFLAGLILPPRLIAPPPPLPISHIALQPAPILHMLSVDLNVSFPQMRVYLQLKVLFLVLDDGFKPVFESLLQDFASVSMIHDIGGGKYLFATRTCSCVRFAVFLQVWRDAQLIKSASAKRTLFLFIRGYPLFDAMNAKDMCSIGPTVDPVWIGHELQTNTTYNFFLDLLLLNESAVHTFLHILHLA